LLATHLTAVACVPASSITARFVTECQGAEIEVMASMTAAAEMTVIAEVSLIATLAKATLARAT